MVTDRSTSDVLLADVRLLAKAAELGGLAPASRALGLQKASATRQLQRLERALGSRLIHRSGGRFALTEEGRSLLPYAQRGLAAIDEGVHHLLEQHGPLSGVLRIAAPNTYGRKVIGPRLPGFMLRHADLCVSLVLGSQRADLLADEADIAIRIGESGSESLIARKLSVETFLLCASPAYLARSGPLERPGDLARHRFVDLRIDPNARDLHFEGEGGSRRAVVVPVLRSNEPDVVIEVALRGLGVAVVPHSMTAGHIARGELLPLLPGWKLPPRDVNALYAPGRGGAPKIRAFLDYLAKDLANDPAVLAR